MSFTLKPRWRFISKAVYEEFKRSRWYKIVSFVTIAFTILNILGLFGLKIPVPTPSWRLAVFFLMPIVVALVLVIEAVYTATPKRWMLYRITVTLGFYFCAKIHPDGLDIRTIS
jgi:hypothetical protein